MEKLAVFKLIDDRLELCGYFSSKETAEKGINISIVKL